MGHLGRYEIVSEIGRGGMGIVYRAVDTALGRTVALKTISTTGQAAPEEAQQLRVRLMREAQAAATLSHPNIVTVHDVGQEGENTYVVMEFVQGGTLDHVLAESDLLRSPEAAMKVLEDVARALDYAHAHGIVHRDVKPANIFIEDNGGVKLGDFGIAKVTWSRTMTEAGAVAGSPHYMAPEQFRGERVTGRTDQFALAAVAYRLLIGHRPFDGDTFASLVSKVLFQEAPSPAAFGVQLRPEAEQVLRKGMSKNPADRFVNCTEFVGALKEALLQSAPAPKPASAQTHLAEPRKRSWVLPVALAAIVLLLAAGLFVFLRRQNAARADAAAWESAKASKDAAHYEVYLKRYPQGRFAADAQRELDTIRKRIVVVPPIDQPPKEIAKSELPKKEIAEAGGKPPDVKKVGTAGVLLKALGQRVSPKDGLVYIRLPAGTFQMGCTPGPEGRKCDDDDLPAHSVALSKQFWIGQTEVTVEAYQHFTQATGGKMPPAPGVASYWREPKQPMLNITWEEAGSYCKWAGGRLPTEAEWEYAARAGNPGPVYGKPDEIAWYSGDRGSGNSDYKPHPVGQKAPNALGLYDMLGNAQEWVREATYKYDADSATDPAGPTAGGEHILRGGGFQSSLNTLRADFRYRSSSRSGDYGFRCVLPAQ